MFTDVRKGKLQCNIYIKTPNDLSDDEKKKICEDLMSKIDCKMMDIVYGYQSEYFPKLENEEVIKVICE